MAAYTRGRLVLNNPNGTYRPGEVCSGTVIVTTREAHSVLGVSLHFLGEVTATLPLNNGVTLGETFEVMNFYEILSTSGDKDAQGNRQLAEGENRFPFKSQLPEELPSNFCLESVGSIKYTLELKIEIFECFSTASTLELHIVDSLDLNTIQGLREAHWCLSFWNNQGCICKQKVQLEASIKKTGFAIGEVLSCQTKIENKSKSCQKLTIRCALIQVVTPRVDGINLECRREICSTPKQPCPKGDSEQEVQGFFVPEVHASYISGLLDITYELAAIVEDNRKKVLLRVKIPIVIGNTSLRDISETRTSTTLPAAANESRSENSVIQINDGMMLI